jgi:hypothetical protein
MAGFADVDMNGVEPQDDFSPIPVGEYVAVIVASEVKQTKDYTGKYIKLEVEIVDGKYKKRKLWQNLNLWNRNEQAVAIAKREMASIKIATGKPNATDTVEFHNRPVLITVGIKPASDGYDAQNVIKGWKPVAKTAAPAAPAAAPQPVTAQATSKPWESVQPAQPAQQVEQHEIF